MFVFYYIYIYTQFYFILLYLLFTAVYPDKLFLKKNWVLNVSVSLNVTWLQMYTSFALANSGKLPPFPSISRWEADEMLILRAVQKEFNTILILC